MFESITWTQYFIALLVCTFVYYLFVWYFYFNTRLPKFHVAADAGNFYDDASATDVTSISAQELISNLRPVFHSNLHKNELILALQLQLKPYRSNEAPGFREAINAFIVEESLTTCSIRLGEEDQRAVWI